MGGMFLAGLVVIGLAAAFRALHLRAADRRLQRRQVEVYRQVRNGKAVPLPYVGPVHFWSERNLQDDLNRMRMLGYEPTDFKQQGDGSWTVIYELRHAPSEPVVSK